MIGFLNDKFNKYEFQFVKQCKDLDHGALKKEQVGFITKGGLDIYSRPENSRKATKYRNTVRCGLLVAEEQILVLIPGLTLKTLRQSPLFRKILMISKDLKLKSLNEHQENAKSAQQLETVPPPSHVNYSDQ